MSKGFVYVRGCPFWWKLLHLLPVLFFELAVAVHLPFLCLVLWLPLPLLEQTMR